MKELTANGQAPGYIRLAQHLIRLPNNLRLAGHVHHVTLLLQRQGA